MFIDESATDSLVNFIHPTDAIYVIGKTSYSPYITHFREGIDKCVKIPTVTNGGGFWGDHSITMILLALIFAMPIRVWMNDYVNKSDFSSLNKIYQIGVYCFHIGLFLLSIIELAQSNYNPFIYFRF